MVLPNLPNYISVPDFHPHCEICGYRGIIVADFLHTNYKGAIYECISCDRPSLFIDQEDECFSIDYWNMTQTDRKIYMRMSDDQKKAFSKINFEEKKKYLKKGSKHRKEYMKKLMTDFYMTIG